MGLIWYAEVTHDTRLMQFVRDSYEYLRTFGIARIGLFGEMCTTGDMAFLAIKLSRLGVGDYWDDVDGYVRNQLAELQITDADKLRRAAQADPVLKPFDTKGPDVVQPPLGNAEEEVKLDPIEETDDNIFKRNVGIYLSCSSHPTHIPKHNLIGVVCCPGTCTTALFQVWDSIVRFQDGAAQVNLLLNRVSPWLDVDSYLPYEGKVVIRNKSARRLSVRLPGWVDRTAVKSEVNDTRVAPFRVGQYLVFDPLKGGETVTITFPVVESVETYTLTWKESDFWKECTDPGHSWTPLDNPDRFTFTFRGNTVVDVAPRKPTREYPLYERDVMKQNKAPMKKVTRFVTPVSIQW